MKKLIAVLLMTLSVALLCTSAIGAELPDGLECDIAQEGFFVRELTENEEIALRELVVSHMENSFSEKELALILEFSRTFGHEGDGELEFRGEVCCDKMRKVHLNTEFHVYYPPLPANCMYNVTKILRCDNCHTVWSVTETGPFTHIHKSN